LDFLDLEVDGVLFSSHSPFSVSGSTLFNSNKLLFNDELILLSGLFLLLDFLLFNNLEPLRGVLLFDLFLLLARDWESLDCDSEHKPPGLLLMLFFRLPGEFLTGVDLFCLEGVEVLFL